MGCRKGAGTKVSWWGGAGVTACSYLPVEQAESPTSWPRHRSLFPSPDAGFCPTGGRTCWLMNRLCTWEIAPKWEGELGECVGGGRGSAWAGGWRQGSVLCYSGKLHIVLIKLVNG